jgi:multimeric flavodoxin WrbA
MKKARGIILASPVYFGSATALIKALIERVGYIVQFRLLSHKTWGGTTLRFG